MEGITNIKRLIKISSFAEGYLEESLKRFAINDDNDSSSSGETDNLNKISKCSDSLSLTLNTTTNCFLF